MESELTCYDDNFCKFHVLYACTGDGGRHSGYLTLRVTLKWSSISSRGEQKFPSCFMQTGISSGLLGTLAHMQTFSITGMVPIQNVNYDWSIVFRAPCAKGRLLIYPNVTSTAISSEMISEVLVFVGVDQQYVIPDNTYSPPPRPSPPPPKKGDWLPDFQSQWGIRIFSQE